MYFQLKLKGKIFFPLTLGSILLAIFIYFFFHFQLTSLTSSFLRQIASNKAKEVESYFTLASQEAIKVSSLFVKLPEVKKAYELALSGNIDNESDPKAQEARELLRNSLKDILAGYESILGEKLQLHFHLPNGRSLVRLWRQKNARKGDRWVDISDDISSFRQTVMTTSKTQEKVLGIEIGRGGFSLRGVVPILDENHYLGSVETLVNFNSVLKAAIKNQKEYLAVYMLQEHLPIATKLQDPKKYPLKGNFVQVYAPNSELNQMIIPSWLEQGTEKLFLTLKENYSIATFPIKDFSGKTIGVMTYIVDAQDQITQVKHLEYILLGGVFLILILFLLLGIFVVNKSVLKPLSKLTLTSKKISTGDLDTKIDFQSEDEIGELAASFALMVQNLKNKIQETLEKTKEAEQATLKAQQALEEAKKANLQAQKAAQEGRMEAAQKVKEVNGVIEKNAQALKANSEKTLQNTKQQKNMLQEIATAMEEMNATVLEIAKNSSQAANLAEESQNQASESFSLAKKATSFMEEVQQEAKNMQKDINQLGSQAQEIGKVINVIEDIADQTNLLALNAAIEAARAGDAGRGFAVVADEVRKLAEKTMSATKEVGEAIETIQNSTQENIQKVNSVAHIIAQSQEIVERTGKSLETIVELTEKTADSIRAIATATEEQSATTEEISRKTLDVNAVGEETNQLMQLSIAALKELEQSILDLKKVIESLEKEENSSK